MFIMCFYLFQLYIYICVSKTRLISLLLLGTIRISNDLHDLLAGRDASGFTKGVLWAHMIVPLSGWSDEHVWFQPNTNRSIHRDNNRTSQITTHIWQAISKDTTYPRWPSIFILYLFYKFHGTFLQSESESIAQQLLTIGLTITTSNTFTTNSVYLFLCGYIVLVESLKP